MKLAWVFALLVVLLRTRMSSGWVLHAFSARIMKFEPLAGIDEHLVDFRDIRVVGEEHSLNGTVHILEDLDPKLFQMSIDFQHDPMRNSKWKPMILNVPIIDVCMGMRLFVGLYGKTTLRQGENTNLPFLGDQCPVPQGSYFVKNLLINTDTWPDLTPHGGVQIHMRFYKQKKFVGGFRLTLNVERRAL